MVKQNYSQYIWLIADFSSQYMLIVSSKIPEITS